MSRPTTSAVPAVIITVLTLLTGLLSTTVLTAAPAVARAPAAVQAPVHDALYAPLRVRGHGRCVISKSDAQRRAHLRCRDGLDVRLRPCPYEDSRHCFWHATVRGNGHGRSFVVYEGRHYFRP
jgi:hypothetical protein